MTAPPPIFGRALGDVLLIDDLSELIDASPSAANRLLLAGAFGPAVRIGRRWCVLRTTLLAHLEANAAAVIFCHNHPSGFGEPSTHVKRITERLKDALGLVDIRVLDHFIVTGEEVVSFAELGLV